MKLDDMAQTRRFAPSNVHIIAAPLAVLWALGCASSPPPAEAPTETAAASESEEESQEIRPEASATPSSLQLVEATAAQIASRWKTEKAIEDGQVLSVRLKLDGKSAIVLGDKNGGRVLTGMDAVNHKTDVLVEITKESADAIAEGGSTIHDVYKTGALVIDNASGFELFLGYIDDE